MATLSIGLAGSGIVNGSKNYTINDAATTKMIAWARATYPPPSLPDTRTDQQCLVQWTDSCINALKDAVSKFDKDLAAKAAFDAEPPIVIT